jgi:hypothetical protein
MKQLTALAWKEWRETWIFLVIGLGVFLGLPVIAAVEARWQYSRRFEISTVPWVVAFGAVLAVFVAVGATCRDFNEALEGFWRSRPVGVTRWLIIKFGVGVAVVVIACGIPLVAEALVGAAPRVTGWDEVRSVNDEVASCLLILPSFSLGFLAGCLVRRAAHAAILALAGVLLIYLLPVVLPPLNWLSAANLDRAQSGWPYVGGVLGLTAAAFLLALIAAWRGWQVESGQRMLYWTIGLSIVIAVWSAGYQLGTNMLILDQVQLNPDEYAIGLRWQGTHGILQTQQDIEDLKAPPEQRFRYIFRTRTVEVTSSGLAIGPGNEGANFWFWDTYRTGACPANDPRILYDAYTEGDFEEEQTVLRVWTVDKLTANILLDKEKVTNRVNYLDTAYVWHNRLYVIGTRLWTFDVTNPRYPSLISKSPISYSMWGTEESGAVSAIDVHLYDDQSSAQNDIRKFSLLLPPIAELPPQQRLEFAIRIRQHRAAGCFDGQILCQPYANGLVAYRLTKLTDKKADFELIGQTSPSILESAFGRKRYHNSAMQLQNGLLYVTEPGVWTSGIIGGSYIMSAGVSVYDIRGAAAGNHSLRLVGHFGAEASNAMHALPDGRSIVAGDKVWLVGPPPGISGK